MLTLWDNETTCLLLAIASMILVAVGLIILRPHKGFTALPPRNRIGFVLILLGLLLACITAMFMAANQLFHPLTPT